MRIALHGCEPILEVGYEDALDLLEWLGLSRPEFGAIEVRAVLPLCRRRLWPEPRNFDPEVISRARHAGTLRRLTRDLAAAISGAPDGVVTFG